ncbi:MAG TPA: polysaccharide deacetylase family protein [Nitrososphaeraceae archaeon]|nr:polysaccharide deacetylase family protein [Nitrososphaeraceae archaeon]
MTQVTLSSSLVSCFRHPATNVISIGLLSILALLAMSNFVFQPSFSSEIISLGNNGTARSNCNCVVFRMDDIQDYWLKSGQLAAMNQFISRNQSLTLGIIMGGIGNDTEIVNKVKEGSDRGLFELAVHGWNHTDYTKLSEEEQRKSLDDSNRKMIELFGNTSEIFIPPLNSFNNDTINAMEQVGMKILDANSSSFDELELKGHNESRALSSLSIQSKDFFYMPSTIAFKDYYQDLPIKNSIQNIFNNVTQSIATNGYAVIIIHPQDFVKVDANGSLTDALDENETNDLSRLIDLILSNNIPLGSFFEVTEKLEMKDEIIQSSNSTSQNILADQVGAPLFMGVTPNLISTAYNNCSGGWEVTADFSPSESDYDGRGFSQAVTIYGLDDANNTTIRTLNSEFLKAVEMEGWGLTKQGDYVGGWDGKFWGPSSGYLTYQGEPLVAGISAATDGNVISYGSNFTIPTLPSPWNSRTFAAVDIGSIIVGKQVSIYTGVGSNAEKEAAGIAETETNTVCVFSKPQFVSTGNSTRDQFDSYIINASDYYGIPDKLVAKSLVMQESSFDPFLISSDIPCGIPDGWTDQESRSFGLMQVTPACQEVGSKRPNLTTDTNSGKWATSLFNPDFNINQGVNELSRLLFIMKSKFPECTNEQYMLMALGAYNSGEDAIGGCDSWNERANDYITGVTRNYRILSEEVNIFHSN